MLADLARSGGLAASCVVLLDLQREPGFERCGSRKTVKNSIAMHAAEVPAGCSPATISIADIVHSEQRYYLIVTIICGYILRIFAIWKKSQN